MQCAFKLNRDMAAAETWHLEGKMRKVKQMVESCGLFFRMITYCI